MLFHEARHLIQRHLFTEPELREDPVFDIAIESTINHVALTRLRRDALPHVAGASTGIDPRDVFRRYYGGVFHAHRSPQLAFLGRLMDAGADPLHGELLSYLFFAPEFAHALIERGQTDAQAWLEEPHDEGLWDTGPLGRRKR